MRFHDGAELRAADVKRSIERTLHPRTPSPGASQYDMIEGFAEYRAGAAPHLAGVRVLGDHAVAIDLRAPDATFLPLMTLALRGAGVPLVSGAAVGPAGRRPPLRRRPVPRSCRWDQERQHRGSPATRGTSAQACRTSTPIEWQTGVPPTTQRYKFEEGELDVLRDLTAIDAAAYRAAPGWRGTGAG